MHNLYSFLLFTVLGLFVQRNPFVRGATCTEQLASILQCRDDVYCIGANAVEIYQDCAAQVCPYIPDWAQDATCLVYCAENKIECESNDFLNEENAVFGTAVNCLALTNEQCHRYQDVCYPLELTNGRIFCVDRTNLDFTEEPSSANGNIQYSVQHATSDYWGRDTSAGPDGGVEACAWAVNNIMSNAGLRKIGDNPNYVPSVVDALKAGRGRQIQASQAVAGDLVVACGEQHIGVCMENNCNTIDSNSSSRHCFCWRSGFNFDNYFGCGSATYWRIEN